jgi:hypothetical protein
MRSLFFMPTLLAGLAVPVGPAASTESAKVEPRVGQWHVERSVQGTPRSEPAQRVSVCLREDQLRDVVTVFRNAAITGVKNAPVCTPRDVVRTGSEVSWKGQCTIPVFSDPAPMTGRALIAAAEVDITQELKVSAPFGKLTVTERLRATHAGPCP